MLYCLTVLGIGAPVKFFVISRHSLHGLQIMVRQTFKAFRDKNGIGLGSILRLRGIKTIDASGSTTTYVRRGVHSEAGFWADTAILLKQRI